MAVLLAVLAAVPILVWLFSRAAVLAFERAWPPLGALLHIDGRCVHVVDVPGRPGAPALLLIHGASGNVRDVLLPLQAVLGGRFRLIAVDRPGNGFTSRGPRGISDPVRQAELVAAVLGRLGVGSCLVLGQSWGGAVATALAIVRPDLVQGLVLVAPASHPWPGGVSQRTVFFATSPIGRVLAELVVVPVGLATAGRIIRAIFRPEPPPADYARRIGAFLAIRPGCFVANCRDIADLHGHLSRLSLRYREIAAPTEIVTGDGDIVCRPAIHAHALVRDIPGARLTVLPGAGHMPHWTRTPDVVAAIERSAERAQNRLRAAAE
jgi:pimeloyl-ACP methyl ester carboxylesterase